MKLSEAKNIDDLYHFTSLNNAIKIIEDDYLGKQLPDKSWDFFSRKKVKKPIISFTRDKKFHKKYRAIGALIQVGFVVNAKKLSNNFKIKPHHDESALFSPYKEDAEAEERVEKLIPRFVSKYVRSIFVIKSNIKDPEHSEDYVDSNDILFDMKPEEAIDKLRYIAKSKGIKVREI